MSDSSFNLTGLLQVTTTRKVNDIAISSTIDGLETKDYEVTIPTGGAYTAVPMPFSAGVTHALVMHLYAPRALKLKITSVDADFPGPIVLGILGHYFLTLTPDEGISAIEASNPSTDTNVSLQVAFGAKGMSSDDDPEYYDVPTG